MESKELEEIVNLATKVAFEEMRFHLDRHPQFISRRQAKRKYKKSLERWEWRRLVKPIRTTNVKHEVFPLHELELQYNIFEELRWKYITGQLK